LRDFIAPGADHRSLHQRDKVAQLRPSLPWSCGGCLMYQYQIGAIKSRNYDPLSRFCIKQNHKNISFSSPYILLLRYNIELANFYSILHSGMVIYRYILMWGCRGRIVSS
jgi:hypothetical protein